MVDLVVSVADGGTSMSDLKVLRNQPDVFGAVASDPTAWRVLASVNDDVLAVVNAARAAARAAAWSAGARPPKDFIVLDFDATLVTPHSEKEDARPTYKHGFGISSGHDHRRPQSRRSIRFGVKITWRSVRKRRPPTARPR